MKSIFNLDSPVMTILTEIADLIILNLIYLFFCMPIVTIGAATAALYRVMLNYEKGESVNPVRQFWKAFRENWKGATILFLIYGLYALLFSGHRCVYIWRIEADTRNELYCCTYHYDALVIPLAHAGTV